MSVFKLSPVLLLILVVSIISGCSSMVETPIPTPYPSEHIPTVIAMTLEAQGIKLPTEGQVAESTAAPTMPSLTQEPAATQLPSPAPIEFTVTPSPTPIPTEPTQNFPPPANIPQSINQILSPGSGSKVVSPFILRAVAKPGSNSAVRIELLGEGGRLLMREVRRYQSLQNEWVNLGSEVTFGINAAAENGRLQISIEDEYGRLVSVSSINIILQSMGFQDLDLPEDQLENIVLVSPRPNRLIQGGTMRVAGLARLRSAQPLMIEILTSDGRIVGTRQVSVIPSLETSYGTFAIDVPYTVDKTNRVRVQVWEPGDRIPGIVNLSSVEVLLSP
jgi:hypothetical protein